ncbi:ComEA family DNA-binding protein [Rubrivirga sp.]|uniref:ComEA family DNA-binding protein n=1 Tax=Rubrivirga sp. TaxID=1885344 RepID=UPI003B525764
MRWLYRLQARTGLTGPEGTAALVIVLALLGGTVARHVQSSAAPVPADLYAAADAAFATAADTAAVATAWSSAPTPSPASPSASWPPDSSASDSSASQIAEAVVERAAAPRRSGKPPPAPTNVNTASAEELQRLPRIGPALAGRIVEHRRVHGPFRSAEALTDVRGIGDKTLEKLRPWVRL